MEKKVARAVLVGYYAKTHFAVNNSSEQIKK